MLKEYCCSSNSDKDKPAGFLKGLLFGLIPHSFCIAFIVFTIIGSTIATSLMKNILLIPNFFQLLLVFSFLMSLISAGIYLKRINLLSLKGVATKWKYLSILIGTTVGVNLLFFKVVFPAVANVNFQETKKISQIAGIQNITLKVNIPCSGHAPLISQEIKKISGITDVKFISPDLFAISFDSTRTNRDEIMNLEIFKTFLSTIIK
jgi:hypothetical protein